MDTRDSLKTLAALNDSFRSNELSDGKKKKGNFSIRYDNSSGMYVVDDLDRGRVEATGHDKKRMMKEYGIKDDAPLTDAAADPVLESLVEIVKANKFLAVGDALKKAGYKESISGKKVFHFVTSPFPLYLITNGKRYAILNKKYAEKPDAVVGQIAVGVMDSMGVPDGVKDYLDGHSDQHEGSHQGASDQDPAEGRDGAPRRS